MSSFSAIERDVELVRQLVAVFSNLGPQDPILSRTPLGVPVIVNGPVQRRNGTHVVNISFRRGFLRNMQLESFAPTVVVVLEWEVSFGPAYPTEPCIWQLVEGRNTSVGLGGFSQVVTLQPFLTREVVSRLTTQKKTHLSMYDSESDKKTDNSDDTNSDGSGSTAVSSFVSDFAFLNSWWAALRLDEGCITSCHGDRLPGSTFFESTNTLDDYGGRSHFGRDPSARLLGEVEKGRVQRPKRRFAAVIMPRGRVLAWGVQQRSRSGINSGGVAENTAQTASVGILQSGTMLHHDMGEEEEGDLSEAEGMHEYQQQQQQHYGHHSQSAQHVVCITSVQSGMSQGSVLPSLLVSSNILHTEVYQIGNICLCADNPCTALLTNARICESGGKTLSRVSNVFRMLRHLIKGVLPHATSIYMSQVLAPAIHRVVEAMQAQGDPFWAGVVICCVLLPSVLNKRPVLPGIAECLINLVESYRCVSLVAAVFFLLGFTSKFHEAELAKKAIVDAYRAKTPLPRPASTTVVVPRSNTGDGVSPVHNLRITECAVCGLSLLREVNRGWSDGLNGGPSGGVLLSPASKDGCLILQCVRCGHGGHLGHINDWWGDKRVTSCPKGCGCFCIY